MAGSAGTRSGPGAGRSRRHQGQSLLELAFALPLLLLIMLGTLDLGQMFFQYIQMRDGVRQGAAYGARNPTDTAGIRRRVQDDADTSLTVGGAEVSIAATSGCTDAVNKSSGTVTVTWNRTFTPITTSFLSAFFNIGSVSMNASATARCLT